MTYDLSNIRPLNTLQKNYHKDVNEFYKGLVLDTVYISRANNNDNDLF